MKKLLIAMCILNISLYADSLELGLGSVKFDYNEYTEDGTWLDSEKNLNYMLDGGFIKYDYDLGVVREEDIQYDQKLELYYSFHLNTTNYNGSLSDGSPHQTNTDNTLHQGHLRYKAINSIENYQVGIFVGLGYRYWDRNILGDSGYLETYEWPYYEAGLSWKWSDGNFFMGIDASYQKAYKPTMIAYTKNKTNIGKDLDFDLGETKGRKLSIPIGYKMNTNWNIIVKYVYDEWKIEKSNVLQTATSPRYEPSSKTKNRYTYISLEYIF
jgi:hypothetical protein